MLRLCRCRANINKISDANEHTSVMPDPQTIQVQNDINEISDAHEHASVMPYPRTIQMHGVKK